ncbi:MAG: PQQ-binding-like beta-propeller repeat protein [Planctomycetia bacterium]|nr:PQQ-binding-like beta-propeller repeat protein [Planctomycetia bacterium]
MRYPMTIALAAGLATWLSLPPHQVLAAEASVPRFLTARQTPDDVKVHPPERWSATENVAWKTDLAGLGWSSPIVWGKRVYVTTCVNTGQTREPRKGLYIEDVDANKYPPEKNEHLWKVYCLDLDSGSIVWERQAHKGIPAKPHHLKNTLASETPTTDGERVYALFGNVGLFCYDMDGQLLWTHKIAPRDTRYGWGTAMSPVIHKDRLYLVNDNEEKSSFMALDKRTGAVIWEVPRDEQTNYSTPFVWENPQRTEIVISGINWATSYDLDGKELWKIKGKSILAIPTPFERFGLLYVTSGHVLWGENRLYAVKPGAAGDLSPTDDGPLSEHLAWYQKAGPYHPTPLIIGDNLYMLLDRGFMACYNAKTGETIYDKKRIPNGRAFTSSPWSYAGKLFCLNEDGVTFVIEPSSDFKILYTNELAEDDMCMATPVIVGDRLLLRSSARVYCLQENRAAAAAGGK